MQSYKKITDLFNPIKNPSGGFLPSKPVDRSKLTFNGTPNLSKIFNGPPTVSPAMRDFGSRFRIAEHGGISANPNAPRPIQEQGAIMPSAPSTFKGGTPLGMSAQTTPMAPPATLPVAPPIATTPTTEAVPPIPSQWMKEDGSFNTPDEIANNIASTLKQRGGQGDIGTMAGGQFSNVRKTTEQLSLEERLLRNARGDIESGAEDPFGVASDSGIAYSPQELQAIENAYAGIYDPAIESARAKVTQRQGEESAAAERQQRIEEMQFQSSLDQDKMRFQSALEQGESYTLGVDQTRFDSEGNVIARGTASGEGPGGGGGFYMPGSNPTVDSWVSLITSKQATIDNAPKEIRGQIAQGLAQAPNPQAGYILQQADEGIRSIDTIMNKITGDTSGMFNTAGNPIMRGMFGVFPGSDSRDVEAARTTLEAIVGFDTLNKMRQSAPSGASGLGQVTEKELKYLQSVQGSLDTGQSNEQLFATLKEVRKSFKIIQAASSQNQSIPSSPQVGDVWKAPDNALYEFVDGAWDEISPGNQAQTFNSVGNTSVSIPQSSRLAFVNNNPGNLRFAGQSGASQGEGGFARFPSPEAGVQALQRQISLDASRNLTLAQFISKYAPPTENNTNQYIQDMMSMTGASQDTPISQIDLALLTRAIAKKESSTNIA